MAKQMDINDLMPSEIKEETRRFIDTQYQGQQAVDALPPVRNRHEGYGLLAEGYVNVNSAMDSVKAAMRDCLKSLAGTDGNFQDAASNTFNSLLDTCNAVVSMGVQAMNVIYKIMDVRQSTLLPLEEAADEAASEEAGDPPGLEDEEVPDMEDEEVPDMDEHEEDE